MLLRSRKVASKANKAAVEGLGVKRCKMKRRRGGSGSAKSAICVRIQSNPNLILLLFCLCVSGRTKTEGGADAATSSSSSSSAVSMKDFELLKVLGTGGEQTSNMCLSPLKNKFIIILSENGCVTLATF